MSKKYKKIIILCLAIFLMGCGKTVINEENNDDTDIINDYEFPKVYISVNSYDDLQNINDEFLIYKQDLKYGVIDKDENIVIQAEYDYGYKLDDNGYFVLGNKEDDLKFVILNADLNVVFDNPDYYEYDVVSYNDNILELQCKDTRNKVFLNELDDFRQILELNDEIVPGYIGNTSVINGMILLVCNQKDENGYPNFITLNGEVTYLEDEESCIYTYISYTLDRLGNVLCYKIDEKGSYFHGYYNINNSLFTQLPENLSFVVPVKADGNKYFGSYEGYSIIKKDKEAEEIFVYNINDASQVSYVPYKHVELLDIGKEEILCKDMNDMWGYLDDNFNKKEGIGTYKDATSFNSNGYALVNLDNKEYLINNEGKIVSEGFNGTEAILEDDLYIVKDNDKKYFIRIVE